jgi:hypothetical protein
LLLLKNFVPPFFPQAAWWNQSAASILPHWLISRMDASFEAGYLALGEMPTEDSTGIGLGLSCLLLVSVLACRWTRRPAQTDWTGNRLVPHGFRWLWLVAPWGSLLAYCVKSGIMDAPRLISAYYPLLLPLLLVGAWQAVIVRRRWWRAMVWGVLLLAVPVLVLTPGRPLWPAQTILAKLVAIRPGQRLIARALAVYSVYNVRSDPLASVRALLPRGLSRVGFMGTGDDIDISLWRPFGTRRVEHILPSDSREQIRQRNLQYAVVGEQDLLENNLTLADWQMKAGAELVGRVIATTTVTLGPSAWYVVRFQE